jgi:hypothetical protein
MVASFGPLAVDRCKPRQARKGATVVDDSGAGVWLEEVIFPSGAMRMKTLKTLLLIGFITIGLLWISAEFYSHYQIRHYYQSNVKANPFLQQMLLYRDVNHFMDKRNHDDLNNDNIRYHREATDISDNDTNIIFLGDSFIFGFLLSHRAAIPYQFEEIAQTQFPQQKINGINFGWVSASPYIELNLLKKLGEKYQPDVVILDLDIGDFHDDIRYQFMKENRSIYKFSRWLPFTTLFLELNANKLSDKSFERWVGFPKSQLFVNERPLQQSLPYLQKYTEKNIDALHDYATKELGAKFIVFVNPKTFHYNEKESADNWLKDIVRRTHYSFEIFDYVDELSRSKPYPVISLLPAFQKTTVFPTAFEKDAHWNREGYKVAATEMVEECKQLGCF